MCWLYLLKQMLHSYKYTEVNWELVLEKSTLEIRPTRNSNRSITRIRTRQAGVIDHLMRQLKQMNTNDRSMYIWKAIWILSNFYIFMNAHQVSLGLQHVSWCEISIQITIELKNLIQSIWELSINNSKVHWFIIMGHVKGHSTVSIIWSL